MAAAIDLQLAASAFFSAFAEDEDLPGARLILHMSRRHALKRPPFLQIRRMRLLLLLCLIILNRKPNRQSVYSKGAY